MEEEVDAIYRQVGARIAALRRSQGLTQERLAERVDLNPSYLARVEAGARRATLEALIRIASALSTPVHELFGPTDASQDAVPRELRAALRGLGEEDLLLLARVASRFARAKPVKERARPARRR